jgi:hypothetical protein
MIRRIPNLRERRRPHGYSQTQGHPYRADVQMPRLRAVVRHVAGSRCAPTPGARRRGKIEALSFAGGFAQTSHGHDWWIDRPCHASATGSEAVGTRAGCDRIVTAHDWRRHA